MRREQLYLSTIDENAGTTARGYGLGLEIADYCTAVNMDSLYAETKPRVDAQVQGVKRRMFHVPFNELFPCAIDPLARELAARRYFQALRVAEQYGAKRLVFHGGYLPHVYYSCWYTEQSVLFWKEFLQRVPADTVLCIENVLESDPQWMADIAAGVDDPRFRLCLDVGHAHVCSEIDVMQWLETLAPWLTHFHIHNNDRSFDTHSPLDQGTIPMKTFLTCADALCPDATFTLEVTDGRRDVDWLLRQGILEEET